MQMETDLLKASLKKTHSEVCEGLIHFYNEKFGGKLRGRFKIMRKDLMFLARWPRLSEIDVKQLSDLMLEKGYVMVDLDSYFIVIEERIVLGYRKVPNQLIADYIAAPVFLDTEMV
jgi:hypothetical protein